MRLQAFCRQHLHCRREQRGDRSTIVLASLKRHMIVLHGLHSSEYFWDPPVRICASLSGSDYGCRTVAADS